MTWLLRLIGPSDGHPPDEDSKNETNVKSSGLDVFRLSNEGEALLMHGPHQCAPTYSPNTVWPGLVAYITTPSCRRCSRESCSETASRMPERDMKMINPVTVRAWTTDVIRSALIS